MTGGGDYRYAGAAEHFRVCGPFCDHVELCDACANVFGLCERHRKRPGGTITWKRGGRRAAERGQGRSLPQ